MLVIELTQDQKNDLVSLVDMLLKMNGVASLSKAVELMNVLNTARAVTPEQAPSNL